MRIATIRVVLAAVLLCIGVGASAAEAGDKPLTVFAAASLTDVLQQVGTQYTRATQTPVRFSFAASSALAKQIESGARIDLFFSADQEWMDYLEARKLIDVGSRRNLLANRLVLVAPADSNLTLKIAPGFSLVAALGPNGRIATGDPDSVPVGKYAKSALTSLGVWKDVESRLVRAENVRAALVFVARGEAPLGIVYATDAKVEPKVRIVDVFPENSHPPIAYPVALTSTASNEAARFLDYLNSDAARKIFQRAGFQILTDKTSKASTP